ncbi:bifunctional phosphopantothenoylcysteine decarboxylase/phosphopantothenate--cysteine ligase CoaBC [candidate division WOR-3 bacterium]|nr:bifunctional phosphopantothenoylcysteine decarboxylase/phosphopantothenate--cysteine ligase CoaBC [candidate division WOR-3 bacterium]
MSNILIGLTGSISIYKMPSLIRRLRENKHSVRVVMTESALKLMGESVFSAVTGTEVYTDTFKCYGGFPIPHIDLAKWADIFLVAPASADFIAKLAKGSGDDLLSSVALAYKNKIAVAPAMNVNMWTNNIVQSNVNFLREKGFYFIGPESGSLACNDIGTGRLAGESVIIAECEKLLSEGLLEGKRILITAGAASEPIDPVRVVTNLSSGKTGRALAQEAFRQRAGKIDFVCPPQVPLPHGVSYHEAKTSADFKDAVLRLLPECDIFIMSAAISDFRPASFSKNKIKRENKSIAIEFTPTDDILVATSGMRGKIFTVGFALETSDLEENARKKIGTKKLDLVIANSPSSIGADSSDIVIIGSDGSAISSFEKISKNDLAVIVVKCIADAIRK